MDLKTDSKTVLVILGPTCAGKTGAALHLAQALDTEIISADAMQVYRHMDIGTAKPSPEEMALVRHHMIDIADPSEYFSAGRFIEAVKPVITGLLNKGRIPIVVGGTGLYIRAMTRGIFSGPSADWSLREGLLSLEDKQKGSLYRQLQELDPAAASRIMPADIRRIIRALEVCLRAETGISDLQKTLTRPLPFKFIKLGITRERKELYSLIDARVDSMLRKGLVKEVESLLDMKPGRTALQAIGYKEIAAFLRGEATLDAAVSLIKQRTRNYAKRQLTWFRKEPDIIWTDTTGLSDSAEVSKDE